MSVTFDYPGDAVDGAQLHDELARASIAAADEIRVEVGELVTDEGLETETRVMTAWVTVPDATDEGDVDAVVAAHVPMERYDPTTRLAALARTREAARLRADYDRLAVLFLAVADSGDPAAAIQTATVALIGVLKRRDRAAGLY